jgi:hypothetical protein
MWLIARGGRTVTGVGDSDGTGHVTRFNISTSSLHRLETITLLYTNLYIMVKLSAKAMGKRKAAPQASNVSSPLYAPTASGLQIEQKASRCAKRSWTNW